MSENLEVQQEERRKIREAASRLAEKTGLAASDIEVAILKVLMGGPVSGLEKIEIPIWAKYIPNLHDVVEECDTCKGKGYTDVESTDP